MDRVFISYARKDIEFVRELDAAIRARGRETWVDWEGIPPVDRWLDTILAAIDEADAFLFVITPDSVASEVCQRELDHAVQRHKRLIPLVHRDPGQGLVRAELAELNFIFARPSDSLDEAAEQLVTALTTDLEWVRAHTRLLVRAAEWEREGREASFTLRGRDLVDFEEWLAKSPEKEPAPTGLQTEYLLASRRAVTRRQRILATSVTVGLSLAVGLGTIAYFQNRERVRQETIAEARQLLNRADALREGPIDEVGARERLQESTRSAASALAILHGLGIPSLDADRAVRRSFAILPRWTDLDLGNARIEASGFDATGARLAIVQSPGTLRVWDLLRQEETGSCGIPLAAGESAVAVEVAVDGTRAATAIYDSSPGRGDTEITVWSLPECRATLRLPIDGRRERVALGGDGTILAVDVGSALRLWDVPSGSELSLDGFDDLVLQFALSPGGDRLATVERNRGERVYRLRIRALRGDGIRREWELPERVTRLSWGPAGLVVGGDSTRRYDLDGEAAPRPLPVDRESMALSPDGSLVAVRRPNYVIEVRDAVSGDEIARTSYGADTVALAFGPAGRSLTMVSLVDRSIRIWTFRSEGAYATLPHDEPPTSLRFGADGTHLVTGTAGGELRWRLPGRGKSMGRPIGEPLPGTEPSHAAPRIEFPVARGCDASPTLLSVGGAGGGAGARAVEIDGAVMSATADRGGGRIAILAATRSTRGGCARRLEIRSLAGLGTVAVRELEPVLDGQAASFLQFIGDDRYLAVGTRAGLQILRADGLGAVATLFHPEVDRVAMQGDGGLAATLGSDGIVRVWDVPSVNEIARIETPAATLDLALSPDDRWLATLEPPEAVRLWALAPEELIQQVCSWVGTPCP